jgi:hypothetical protein
VAVTRPSQPDVGSGRVTVPKFNQDPIQSLCPFSVNIAVGTEDVEIPALPACDWLAILMVEHLNLDDIFPGLLKEDDSQVVEEMILAGHLSLEEYESIIFDIIETVSSRSWWVAIRLIETVRTSWDTIGAEMTLRGINAAQVSLSSWLDVALLTIIKSLEPKEVQMWCMKLEAPPPNEKIDETAMEMSPSQFMAMAD